jgi:L-fucose mutarotase
MLIGIDPILGPDLLHALRAMGHGDDIVIADANFPSQANARRLIRADGVTLEQMLAAMLKLLPIDDFEPAAVVGMQVVGEPLKRLPVHDDIARLLAQAPGPARPTLTLIERHAFYARAREAFAVVATGELRFYGNVILRKGTIAPP